MRLLTCVARVTLATMALLLPTSVLAEGSLVRAEVLQLQSTYPSGYQAKIAIELDESRNFDLLSFTYEDSENHVLKYSPDELRQGVVLLRAFGKDIVRIRSPNLRESEGGVMYLDFLRRFFTGDRRRVQIELARGKTAGAWEALTSDSAGRDPFDRLQIQVSMGLGLPSGIDEVFLGDASRWLRRYRTADLPRAKGLTPIR